MNAGFRAEDNANFGTRGVPRAGAAYILRYGRDFWDATRSAIRYGQGIKEPSLDQSFRDRSVQSGKPELAARAESTPFMRESSKAWIGDKLNISADYFLNEFRNIVSFTACFPGGPCPVTPPAGCPIRIWHILQYGFGASAGVNRKCRLARKPLAGAQRKLYRTMTAAYWRRRMRSTLSKRLATGCFAVPVNSGSLALDTALRRFNGNLTGVFVGRRADSDFLFPALGLTSNPGYVRFDLAASFRVTSRLSIIGRVKTCSTRVTRTCSGYPALHRGAYVGLRFRLGGDTKQDSCNAIHREAHGRSRQAHFGGFSSPPHAPDASL